MSGEARFGDWIGTYTGRRFWPLDPRAEDIAIEDIAHALSLQCRWSGHCREFYSVAQHSVLVSWICDPDDALAGLLHDAAEAYVVDLPRPIKRMAELLPYREAEELVHAAIASLFGIPAVIPKSVHVADDIVLAAEARDFMANRGRGFNLKYPPMSSSIEPWPPHVAEQRFLDRFAALTSPVRLRR